MSATDLTRAEAMAECRPWPRHVLDPAGWAALAADPGLALLSLWAEPGLVHAAFLAEAEGSLLLASCPAPDGRYPALSPSRPSALPFERMIRDLWGLGAEGGADPRPRLDHGRWGMTGPLSGRPVQNLLPPQQPEFLPATGEGLHQLPLGPVHGGVTEPAHFRLHLRGERVARLEAQHGYAHRGVIGLMLGKSPRSAARFAARLAGDSTVAHAWAFAMAAEAAAEIAPPPRALILRAVMAELERIRNHLQGWGAICEAAGLAWPHSRCAALREGVLRACAAAFRHRLMMDLVVPGGVSGDIAPGGAAAILAALEAVAVEIPELAGICESHAGLQDRVAGTGTVSMELAARFAAGGPVGRASGRGFDARRLPGHAPYDLLDPVAPVLADGDAAARLRIRIAELRESIRLVPALLARLPEGELRLSLPQKAGEGVGMVEGSRGECLHWMALDDGGLIRAVFPRDPSWLQWPLLEAAMQGGTVADFPLCEASFGCSVAGVDL